MVLVEKILAAARDLLTPRPWEDPWIRGLVTKFSWLWRARCIGRSACAVTI